jgi:hypothetical protein
MMVSLSVSRQLASCQNRLLIATPTLARLVYAPILSAFPDSHKNFAFDLSNAPVPAKQ